MIGFKIDKSQEKKTCLYLISLGSTNTHRSASPRLVRQIVVEKSRTKARTI